MIEDNEKDKFLYILAQGNIHRLYLLKKTDRIATAVLLIADKIERSSALANDLEKQAVALPSISIEILTSGKVESLEKSLITLASLFQIGAAGNRIATRTALFLANECYKLLSFMSERKNELSGSLLIGTQFFEVDEISLLRERSREWNTPALFSGDSSKKESSQSFTLKDRQIRQKGSSSSPRSQGTSSPDTKRRENILALIQEKGRVSIKDISVRIKNCSEKTIQRELSALIREGVLKKEGERRWSTYIFGNTL